MKKALYFILLAVELFVGALLMSSLWTSSLYIPIAVAVVSVVALLVWQIIKLRRASDPEVKKKILRNIALILMIPVAIFFVTYLVVAVAFVIAFAKSGF